MANWKEAARLSDFERTDRIRMDLEDGQMIGIFRLGDEFVAVSGWCSHERASLLRGEVVGEEIQCPIHGARFSLRTGRQRSLPAVRPIASYPVRVEEGVILVDVEGGRT